MPDLKLRSLMGSWVMVMTRWPSLVVTAEGSSHSKSLQVSNDLVTIKICSPRRPVVDIHRLPEWVVTRIECPAGRVELVRVHEVPVLIVISDLGVRALRCFGV